MKSGRYNGKAVDAQLSEASTGTPQIEVVLEVTDEEDKGEQISWFGFLTENALPWTMKSLRTLGFEGDDLSDLSSVIDGACSFTVEEDEWEGQTRLKVGWINEMGGLRSTPMGDKESFARRMAKKIKALEAGQAPKAKSLDEELGGDDVPFE